MIKKLRRKFVLINMSLLTLLLLGVLLFFGLSSVRQQTIMEHRALENALRFAMEDDDERPPQIPSEEMPAGPGGNAGTSFSTRKEGDWGRRVIDDKGRMPGQQNFVPVAVVTAEADDDGDEDPEIRVMWEEMLSISEDTLKEIVPQILSSGRASGVLSSLSLRYSTAEKEDATVIAFADQTASRNVLKSSVTTGLLIFVSAFAALLLLSVFLARWALRPVETAWQQQRQFIADASHELKTPLTVILTNLRILSSHKKATVEEEYRWVEGSQEEAEHMKGLVEDLLFLARSDAEKLPETLSETDLSDIVTGVILSFEPVAFERGVLFEEDVREGIRLTADAGQLRQLSMILIDNACKYSVSPGTVRVSLTEEAGRIRLAVENDGAEISPEELSHLFERFYRVDESRTKNGKGGYGLGLAIAKTIAERHGGSISAESMGGHTVFTVLLPQKN